MGAGGLCVDQAILVLTFHVKHFDIGGSLTPVGCLANERRIVELILPVRRVVKSVGWLSPRPLNASFVQEHRNAAVVT